MRKTMVIALREFRTTVRTKTFMIVVLLMPVLMLGGIVVNAATEGRVDIGDKRIGVVDNSGALFSEIEKAAIERNANAIFDPETGRQVESKFEFVSQEVEGNRDDLLLDLSERVRGKELFAFIEIDSDILSGDATNGDAASATPANPAIRYYSNQPTYNDIYRWLARTVNAEVRSARLARANIDPAIVGQALAPIESENLGLLSRSETGEIQEAKEVDAAEVLIPALGLIMLMWMALVVTVQPMLNCVLEEKMQRISEVLLGSIPPFQLMLGKLIGYVLVSIVLVGIYLLGGYFVADHFGYADIIPFGLLGWFFVFQSLAILMYGSMFLAAGSCCNDYREAQHLVMPIWLPMMIPMFCLGIVMEHPDSMFSMVVSLFPPATPMLMILRMALPPGVPVWQPLAGIAGTLLTTLVCVWAAGRIFRVGLLLSGKPPKITDLIKWAIKG